MGLINLVNKQKLLKILKRYVHNQVLYFPYKCIWEIKHLVVNMYHGDENVFTM